MPTYQFKSSRIEHAAVNAYKKIEAAFVDVFLNEDGSLKTGGMAEKATHAYQNIEGSVVGAYKKVKTAFVNAFLEEIQAQDTEETDAL